MKIHSMRGCSCWRYLRSSDKYERELARADIEFTGHYRECHRHPVNADTSYRFNMARGRERRRHLFLCQACVGLGKNAKREGDVTWCNNCGGQGKDRRSPPLREISFEEKLRPVCVNTEWRKWALWVAYDDAKARLKEATKDATDDQIEELELSLKELMDHLRMQFSEMRVARWYRRGGRRDVAEDIEHRAGLR